MESGTSKNTFSVEIFTTAPAQATSKTHKRGRAGKAVFSRLAPDRVLAMLGAKLHGLP
jgi:hypothetical protein